MDEIAALKAGLAEAKHEINLLAAETMALQFLVVNMCSCVSQRAPELQEAFLQAFDSSANVAERLSIREGRKAAHMPESLRILEELRAAFAGGSKPLHAV
jgi:hypothetical protein